MNVKIIYGRPGWWHEDKPNMCFDVHIINPDSAGVAAIGGFPVHELFFVPDKPEEYKRYLQIKTSGTFPTGRWLPMCDVLHVIEAPSAILVRGHKCSRSAIYEGRNVYIVSNETGNRLRIMKAGGKELMVEQTDPGLMLSEFKEEDVVTSYSTFDGKSIELIDPLKSDAEISNGFTDGEKTILNVAISKQMKSEQDIRDQYPEDEKIYSAFQSRILSLNELLKKINRL